MTSVTVTWDREHRGRHVRAARPLAAGETVGTLAVERVTTQPGQHTLQLDEHRHAHGLGDFVWLNHSCDPNVFVDTQLLVVEALRDIAAGEELTFFYPATELDLAEPFECHCGATRCLGRIQGARHMTLQVLQGWRVNPHAQRGKRA